MGILISFNSSDIMLNSKFEVSIMSIDKLISLNSNGMLMSLEFTCFGMLMLISFSPSGSNNDGP